MRTLTAAQMQAAEAAAVAAGSSYRALMENAGTAAADRLETLAAQRGLAHSALLLCGKGNNAGDAFVIARLLAQKGWQVQLVQLLPGRLSPLAALNLGRLPAAVQRAAPQTAHYNAAFLVDGVFGTGFSGQLSPPLQAIFAKANAAPGLRVALDIPSGLNCDDGSVSPGCFAAAVTLTFGAYKPGLLLPQNAGVVGQLHCLDIGL